MSTLKPSVPLAEVRVSCPVRGCRVEVPYQEFPARATREYQCPVHRIYLAAGSFRYERETDNLLWAGRDSLNLLNTVRASLRGMSLGFDLSEEAVTWNVFGWLDRAGLLAELLEGWSERSVLGAEAWYWGYSRVLDAVPPALRRARIALGEDETNGDLPTAPPVMVEAEDALYLLDTRIVSFRGTEAGNRPAMSGGDEGGRWAEEVLEPGWQAVLPQRAANELIRYWLVGSYAAKLVEKDFVLVHVVPRWAGEGAAPQVWPYLRGTGRRELRVACWEDVYELACDRPGAPDSAALRTYMEEKSAGYDSSGRLLRCFSLASAGSPVAGASVTRVS
ncbi:MAG: hypothetical protein Kow00129_03320 [Thermoleophilia bacterium]